MSIGSVSLGFDYYSFSTIETVAGNLVELGDTCLFASEGGFATGLVLQLVLESSASSSLIQIEY